MLLAYVPTGAVLSLPDADKYNLSGVKRLPMSVTQGLELGCLVLFGLDLMIKYAYTGRERFFKSRINFIVVMCAKIKALILATYHTDPFGSCFFENIVFSM